MLDLLASVPAPQSGRFAVGAVEMRPVSQQLMRQDGLEGPRAWARLVWYLWIRPGMFRKIAGAWLKFFLPGFHPWNEDDRDLLRAYEAAQPAEAAVPAKQVRRARA